MSSLVTPFLQQTISTISTVSRDGYGDETYTSAYTSVKCRWQESTRQLVNAAGEQVLARAECWLEVGKTLHIGDKFTFGGEDYFVINYSTKYNLFGQAEFTKVYLH